MNQTELKKRLKTLWMYPKKSMGQNFLINDSISYQISQQIQSLQSKHIVEIGPGLGSLTEYLKEIKTPLTLVELDSKLCQFWKNKKLTVIQKNALHLLNTDFVEGCSVVGNLPYSIASSLIVKACLEWNRVESMVLMMQKEVGCRVISLCGQKIFGLLSVISQYVWDCEYLQTARVSDFYPPPKVEGIVISFKKKKSLPVSVAPFFYFVKKCFQQKRKILKTNLKNINIQSDDIQTIFQQLELPLAVRAEELSVSKWVQLYQQLQDRKYQL